MDQLMNGVLCAIGSVLPPVARLHVLPAWKLADLADQQLLTVGEARVLAKWEREMQGRGR